MSGPLNLPSFGKILTFKECVRLWPQVIVRTPPGVDQDLAYRIEELIHRPGWEPGHITLEAMRRLCLAAVHGEAVR